MILLLPWPNRQSLQNFPCPTLIRKLRRLRIPANGNAHGGPVNTNGLVSISTAMPEILWTWKKHFISWRSKQTAETDLLCLISERCMLPVLAVYRMTRSLSGGTPLPSVRFCWRSLRSGNRPICNTASERCMQWDAVLNGI